MSHERKTNENMFLVGGCLIFAFIIMVIILFRGTTTNLNITKETKNLQSLSCESEGIKYPFFEYDESEKKTLKINAIFNGDEISTISLIYKLYYSDSKKITDSENLNHVAMSKSFGDSDLGFDALGSKYSKAENLLQFSLYATSDDINNMSIKYFMLKNLDWNDKVMRDFVRKEYENIGMSCIVKN